MRCRSLKWTLYALVLFSFSPERLRGFFLASPVSRYQRPGLQRPYLLQVKSPGSPEGKPSWNEGDFFKWLKGVGKSTTLDFVSDIPLVRFLCLKGNVTQTEYPKDPKKKEGFHLVLNGKPKGDPKPDPRLRNPLFGWTVFFFSSTTRLFENIFGKIGGSTSKNPNNEWVPIFPKERLDPGEIVPITIEGMDLLVVASKDGRNLYCISNSCPHLGTPLETGLLTMLPIGINQTKQCRNSINKRSSLSENTGTPARVENLRDDCIICPLHRTAFSLKTGEVRGEWCPYPPLIGAAIGHLREPTPVATFEVRIRRKQIEVRLQDPNLESKS